MMTGTEFEKLWSRLNESRGQLPIEQAVINALQSDSIALSPELLFQATHSFGKDFGGMFITPKLLVGFLTRLLAKRNISSMLDPTCGSGVLLHEIADQHPNSIAHGVEVNSDVATVADRLLGDRATVFRGDFLEQDKLLSEYDLIISEPPFNLRLPTPVTFSEDRPPLQGDLHEVLAAWAASRLTMDGLAVLIVPGSFARSRRASRARDAVNSLGARIRAYIHIPSGSFQGTLLDAYVVLIERGDQESIFVAQLTPDENHQQRLIQNLWVNKGQGMTAQGRIVDYATFRGYPAIEARETLLRVVRRTNYQPLPMSDVVLEHRRLRREETPDGQNEKPNTLYLHMMARRQAVTHFDQIPSGHQNWFALVLDSELADARFVANLLTKPIGQYFLGQASTGSINETVVVSDLMATEIYLPTIDEQRQVLEVIDHLASVKSYISELETKLWDEPQTLDEVIRQVEVISAEERYEDWVETLPFTLASILWRHQTSRGSSREKYEILLHFFEALAAFLGTIHLSAFSSDRELWLDHSKALKDLMASQHLSMERSTFGSWRCIAEYLAARCRELYESEPEVSQSLYRTQNQATLRCLGDARVIQCLQEANGIRNNFLGHSGAVGERQAQKIHADLESLVQQFRDVWGRQWSHFQLIKPGNAAYSNNVFRHDVRMISGTRTPFASANCECREPLDQDYLYLLDPDADRGLKLLPFVRITSAPEGEATACYFYSKQERGVSRYVSYHYEDEAVHTEDAAIATAIFKDLSLNGGA